MEKGKFSNRGSAEEASFLSRSEARQADIYGVSTREEYLEILANKDYAALSNAERHTLERETRGQKENTTENTNTNSSSDTGSFWSVDYNVEITQDEPSSEVTEPVEPQQSTSEPKGNEGVSKTYFTQEGLDDAFGRGEIGPAVYHTRSKALSKETSDNSSNEDDKDTPPTAIETKEKWFNRLKKSKFGKAAIFVASAAMFGAGVFGLSRMGGQEEVKTDDSEPRVEQTDVKQEAKDEKKDSKTQDKKTQETKDTKETEKKQDNKGNFYDEDKESVFAFGSPIEEGETAKDTLNNLLERINADNATAVAIQAHHLNHKVLQGMDFKQAEEFIESLNETQMQNFIEEIKSELTSKDADGNDKYAIEVQDIEGAFDSSYLIENDDGTLDAAKSTGLDMGGRMLTITDKKTGIKYSFRLNCGGQPIVILSGGAVVELPGEEIPAKEVTPQQKTTTETPKSTPNLTPVVENITKTPDNPDKKTPDNPTGETPKKDKEEPKENPKEDKPKENKPNEEKPKEDKPKEEKPKEEDKLEPKKPEDSSVDEKVDEKDKTENEVTEEPKPEGETEVVEENPKEEPEEETNVGIVEEEPEVVLEAKDESVSSQHGETGFTGNNNEQHQVDYNQISEETPVSEQAVEEAVTENEAQQIAQNEIEKQQAEEAYNQQLARIAEEQRLANEAAQAAAAQEAAELAAQQQASAEEAAAAAAEAARIEQERLNNEADVAMQEAVNNAASGGGEVADPNNTQVIGEASSINPEGEIHTSQTVENTLNNGAVGE